jgi:DNA anti-recombination protein RmuC
MNDSAQSLWRKRQIESRVEVVEQEVGQLKQRVESLNPYRETVIDEVADAILKMEGFGKDTLHSFAIYIRSMK